MEIVKYSFQKRGDSRGELIVVEAMKDIPFEMKRIYYIYGVEKGIERGFHAHKSLEQVLICIHGSCKISLDDGTEKKEVLLDNPSEGIYVGNMIYRCMYDFSEDAVLLVLASELYDESDYIRDYDEFLQSVRS